MANDFPPTLVLGLGKKTTSLTWEPHVGGKYASVWGELESACLEHSMT